MLASLASVEDDVGLGFPGVALIRGGVASSEGGGEFGGMMSGTALIKSEVAEGLDCGERLDRASPDLWPEQVSFQIYSYASRHHDFE